MRYFKLALTAILLATLGGVASGQVTSGLSPQTGAAPPAIATRGKIAVVNTAMFQEQIAEFKSKIEALNRQFEPRVKDVQGLGDRINALETTLKTQSSALPPARIAEMTEQLDTMKKDYKRKGEDLQADASRTRDKAFEPIQAKLGKFAEQYTASRGIVLLLSMGDALQSGTLLWFDPRADITQDFITAYNKANPQAPPPANPKP